MQVFSKCEQNANPDTKQSELHCYAEYILITVHEYLQDKMGDNERIWIYFFISIEHLHMFSHVVQFGLLKLLMTCTSAANLG